MTGTRTTESSIIRLLRIVRERYWVVLTSIAVCVALALILAARTEKQYDATSKLLFRQAGLDSAISNTPLFPVSSDPARDSFTNISLVTSNDVADGVIKELHLNKTPEQVLSQITVQEEENANVADITVRDPDPVLAAKMANAVSDQYVKIRQAQDRAQIQAALGRAQVSAKELLRTGQRGPLADVREAIRKLTALEVLQTGAAVPVDRATPPAAPATPRPKRDAILGFILGLAIGLSLAFLLDVLDSRLKTPEDIETALDMRALTMVPQRAFEARSSRDRALAFEPYRILRGALDFRMLADGLRTLLVTSPTGREGKTTVSVNLARAFAVAGQRVVLVEANLRRPAFASHFQMPPDVAGLTEVLSGRMDVKDALRQSGAPSLSGLFILPAGTLPLNAPELFESRAMHELLQELSAFADLVILDAPPLLPVADARILLDHPGVDSCVVVTRTFQTTRQEARRVGAVLENHDREALGTVICGVKSTGGDSGGAGAAPSTNGHVNGAVSRIRVSAGAAAKKPAGTPTA